MKMIKERIMAKRGDKGFTLMEMLIVVAIIVILVAIAIPVFSTQLEKAREATDDANMRAAKAVAVASYLTEGTTVTGAYFDAVNGTIVTTPKPAGYGKGTAAGTQGNHEGQVIQVSVDAAGVFTGNWVD